MATSNGVPNGLEKPAPAEGTREANLNRPARPMFTTDRFDVPPNSIVRITTSAGTRIIGNCFKNPIHTASTNVIELVNCQVLIPETKRKMQRPLMRISQADIAEMTIQDEPGHFNPDRHIVEKLVSTKIICSNAEIEHMLEVFQTERVDVLGMSFHGINVGQLGKLGWICLITRHQLLICIDVINREKDKEMWDLLDKGVFSNKAILKIVHNLRPIVDYLYHLKCIKVENVFDTQVAELFIRAHTNLKAMPVYYEQERVKGTDLNWQMFPLSKALEDFIPKAVLPEEIVLLKNFECQNFTQKNPLMNRPLNQHGDKDKLTKCIAISMKYLLELQKEQQRILNTQFYGSVREQMKIIMRGNMADHFLQISDPSHVARNVVQSMFKEPLISKEDEKPL